MAFIGPYPKFSLWLQVQRLKHRISNSDVKFFLRLKWWPFLRKHTYILPNLMNTWPCGFKVLPNWMPEKHSWLFLLQSNKTSVFSYEQFTLHLPRCLNWNRIGLFFSNSLTCNYDQVLMPLPLIDNPTFSFSPSSPVQILSEDHLSTGQLMSYLFSAWYCILS